MRISARFAPPAAGLVVLLAACSGHVGGDDGTPISGAAPSPTTPGPGPDPGSSGPVAAPSSSTPPPPASGDGGTTPSNADGGASTADAAPPEDPCPTLKIPQTIFNRNVVYREWGPTATGDGSYFASQAPLRLGFNRAQNAIYIVKIRTDDNTYTGRAGGYGDNSGGITWISDRPDDVSFAVKNRTYLYGNHGGGVMSFTVVDSDAAAQKIATDPAYAIYRTMPQLRGGHCYYVGFENTQNFPSGPVDASFWNGPDDCGAANGTSTCYYLAMDFFHYLDEPTTGQRMAGSVIPGLTH